MRVVVFVLLSLASLVMGIREGWLDPTNPHSYDHVEKRPRPTERPPCRCDENTKLSECLSTLDALQESSDRNQKTTRFLEDLLRRYTGLVLNAAQLNEGQLHGVVEVVLHEEQLAELQRFVEGGKLDTLALDDAWSQMLSNIPDPRLSRWDTLKTWVPEVTREAVVTMIEWCSVIAVIAMIFLQMPLKRVVGVTFILIVLISLILRIHRNLEAVEARQRHEVLDPSSMPAQCRETAMWTWAEWMTLVYKSREELTSTCKKYYEEKHTDPLGHVTPLEHLAHLAMDIVEGVSQRSGTAFSIFCDSAFAELPWPLGTVVCVFVKVGFFVLVLLTVALMLWFFVTRRQSVVRVKVEPPPPAVTEEPSVKAGTSVTYNYNGNVLYCKTAKPGRPPLNKAMSEGMLPWVSVGRAIKLSKKPYWPGSGVFIKHSKGVPRLRPTKPVCLPKCERPGPQQSHSTHRVEDGASATVVRPPLTFISETSDERQLSGEDWVTQSVDCFNLDNSSQNEPQTPNSPVTSPKDLSSQQNMDLSDCSLSPVNSELSRFLDSLQLNEDFGVTESNSPESELGSFEVIDNKSERLE